MPELPTTFGVRCDNDRCGAARISKTVELAEVTPGVLALPAAFVCRCCGFHMSRVPATEAAHA